MTAAAGWRVSLRAGITSTRGEEKLLAARVARTSQRPVVAERGRYVAEPVIDHDDTGPNSGEWGSRGATRFNAIGTLPRQPRSGGAPCRQRSSLYGSAAASAGFGKSRIVEDPDLPSREKCRHSLRIAGSRECAGNDDPVIAGKHTGEALAVPVSRCLNPPSRSPRLLRLYYPVWFRLCRLRGATASAVRASGSHDRHHRTCARDRLPRGPLPRSG